MNEAINDEVIGVLKTSGKNGLATTDRDRLRAAHKADPDALLFYNDYNLEFLNSAKQNAVYNLLKKLLAKGVPIHGVGFQGHFGLEYGGAPSKETIKASIDRFAKLGVYVQFTEVDFRIQIPVNET